MTSYKDFLQDEWFKAMERCKIPPAMIGGCAMGKSGTYISNMLDMMQWNNVTIKPRLEA